MIRGGASRNDDARAPRASRCLGLPLKEHYIRGHRTYHIIVPPAVEGHRDSFLKKKHYRGGDTIVELAKISAGAGEHIFTREFSKEKYTPDLLTLGPPLSCFGVYISRYYVKRRSGVIIVPEGETRKRIQDVNAVWRKK